MNSNVNVCNPCLTDCWRFQHKMTKIPFSLIQAAFWIAQPPNMCIFCENRPFCGIFSRNAPSYALDKSKYIRSVDRCHNFKVIIAKQMKQG